MFDKPTLFLVSIDVFVQILIFVCLSPVLTKKKNVSPLRLRAAIFLVVLFCVLAFWSGDWYHYREVYGKLNEYANMESHMEDIYVFLMRHVCPTYLSFRLLVWGIALGLYYLTIKRLGLNQNYAWLIFGLGFLPYFSYARVSIVPAMLLLGSTFVTMPFLQRRYQSILFGLMLIMLSVFFHKSAFLGIAVMLFSIVVPQTTKNSWFYFLIGFIVASFALKYLFQYVLTMDFSDEAAISRFAEKTKGTVSSSFYGNNGIGPLVSRLSEHIPYFLTAFLAFRIQNNYTGPKGIMTIIKFEFYMVFFSLLFLMDLGSSTSLLYGRYLRFSILPGSITLAYAYQYGLFEKYTKRLIVLSVCCGFYLVLYMLWCKFMDL